MSTVEILYIAKDQSITRIHLPLNESITVNEALNLSGIYRKHPEIKDYKVGIFGKIVSLTQQVKSGDRIEIYRPLEIDPKEKRRRRAGKQP